MSKANTIEAVKQKLSSVESALKSCKKHSESIDSALSTLSEKKNAMTQELTRCASALEQLQAEVKGLKVETAQPAAGKKPEKAKPQIAEFEVNLNAGADNTPEAEPKPEPVAAQKPQEKSKAKSDDEVFLGDI
jgi:chromosome segregation ATPase